MLRWTTLLAVLAAAALGSAATVAAAAAPRPPALNDARDSAGGLDLQQASLLQQGPQLEFDVATYAPWGASTLRERAGRSLCVTVTQRSGARVCVVPAQKGRSLSLVREALDSRGDASAPKPLGGDVERRGTRAVRISFSAADAGLAAGAISWQVASTWVDAAQCPAATAPGCTDLLPDGAAARGRITPFRPIGCRAAGRSEWLSGPGSRKKRIALTFDDGPAADTPQFLAILEREHVPATFFMVGRQVAGRGALLARMLRDGDMIGNHTWDHADVSRGGAFAGSEIDRTQRAIRQASGFTPCLFRPPYGARSAGLVSVARSRRLLTIIWNDDPQDWRRPGAGAIHSTVMSEAHPDGIVLMHDGGGPRSGTIAALPEIIHSLRARGYAFVTVSDLLGLKLVYG